MFIGEVPGVSEEVLGVIGEIRVVTGDSRCPSRSSVVLISGSSDHWGRF